MTHLRHASSGRTRVVVLGAGFGGLELSTRVTEACGDQVDVTLVDRAPGFVFGFSKLDVMFGRTTEAHVTHGYDDAVPEGVRFVHAEVTHIDPVSRVVETTGGALEADVLVIALGAALDPAGTPGLIEGGHDFYTNGSAFALRETLAAFEGGRVVVGVTSTPFKCPPAPSETAMLMHEFLTGRGLRESSEIALVMPFSRPIPPSPEASAAVLDRLAGYDVSWHPNHLVLALDPERGVALLSDGAELPYDLFLGVPRHVAPDVVMRSGLTVDGWIPVDPYTLATAHQDVYAIGDVASVGTPKAGVFAEGQARVVADQIVARIQGLEADARYDGTGTCYVEFGEGAIGRVDITFEPGSPPVGTLAGPNEELSHEKQAFGSSRVERWFGRSWDPIA